MNVFEELVEAGAQALEDEYGPAYSYSRDPAEWVEHTKASVVLTAALERALEPDVLEGLADDANHAHWDCLQDSLRALLDQKEVQDAD